jgi:Toprim-like
MNFEHELQQAYSDALLNDSSFSFKESKGGGQYLEKGTCPDCKKQSLFVKADKPWRVQCNRMTNCSWSENTGNLYPDILDDMIEEQKDPDNPKAKANAFMKYKRGFDLEVIGDWYEQEHFHDPRHNINCATVRFWLDRSRNCYWERLIGKTKSDGQRQNIRGNKRKLATSHDDYAEFDGTTVKGMWWTPPEQVISPGDTVYLVEGIFHAIALYLCGYTVAATLASGYYPELAMREHYGKGILWVWALDSDKAGLDAMAKHRSTMEKKGERTSMSLTGSKSMDWDDYYKMGILSPEKKRFMADCDFRGLMAAAKSVDRKAYVHYSEKRKPFFIVDHKNSLYSIKVAADKVDNEELDQIDLEDKYNHKHVPVEFSKHLKVTKISPCFPQFLYAERNQLTRDLSFFMRVDFGNGAPRVQESLDKGALETSKSFHKALVGIAAGGAFYGNDSDFRTIYDEWFKHRDSSKEVRSLNFMGYDNVFGGYVFRDFGFKDGRFIPVNDIGLIQGEGEKVKSTLKDINFVKPNEKAQLNWLGDIHTAFGVNGLITLAFWYGTFFSEQIRTALGWYHFLEMSGKPGTGKSTILEFLWKASGREKRYEGINPAKYTKAGRGKVMTKLAGLPMVMVEGDVDDAKQAFDINEMKDAFNGGPVRGIGLPTGGSETIEPPFKCGFIVAQNDDVDCEKAMISRFVHLHWTEAHFSERGSELLGELRDMTTEDASAFMLSSLSKEPQIVKRILDKYQALLPTYRNEPGISMPRIQETHALTNACYLALGAVFGEQVDKYADLVQSTLLERAKDRQARMSDDHPDVVIFWEVYELINHASDRDDDYKFAHPDTRPELLNHSADDQLIALNLTEVAQRADVHRYRLPLVKELKRLLRNSRKYRFIDVKTVKSKITEKPKHCWLFSKPQKTGGGLGKP